MLWLIYGLDSVMASMYDYQSRGGRMNEEFSEYLLSSHTEHIPRFEQQRIKELESENLHLKEEILQMMGNHKIETQLQAKWAADARAYALRLEKLIVTIKVYGMRNLTLSDLEEIEDIYDRHTPK